MEVLKEGKHGVVSLAELSSRLVFFGNAQTLLGAAGRVGKCTSLIMLSLVVGM
ncbi:MAG: hypothetical protein JW908_16155 [Anaerolineales bacterium]|nr:hypothetical protein [Anaerolineales bacterium]